ncbi:hypothetical protein Dd586_1495 [Dickeya parazeae Ech586]|uniref:Uncharacterized protein n=1 Tax=Dickeya zeae (strain Ech586) TaxID=590409 RepID=D2BWX9_DICZ5|nr:hypothetical protein Dd586_1495 [Dickeya parazeae Ech586]
MHVYQFSRNLANRSDVKPGWTVVPISLLVLLPGKQIKKGELNKMSTLTRYAGSRRSFLAGHSVSNHA